MVQRIPSLLRYENRSDSTSFVAVRKSCKCLCGAIDSENFEISEVINLILNTFQKQLETPKIRGELLTAI